MKSRWFFIALCLVAALVFVYGATQIFRLRFERGDVYPPYSSLRTDPLGAKIFFESLARAERDVSRNQSPLEQFSAEEGTTLFYLGAEPWFWREPEIVALERFVEKGGRLVITFYPQQAHAFHELEREDKKKSPSPTPTPEEEPEFKVLTMRELAKRWGFVFDAKRDLIGENATALQSSLDRKISWHSSLHFDGSSKDWQSVYAVSKHPVVIERHLGRGTIVLASDSYFVSNEAMVDERRPMTLAWLAGASAKFIFDETHLGVLDAPGVSALIRRHGLGGLFAGIILLAILCCWKNAARLIPAQTGGGESEVAVIGKDSFDGLINLLRRNIPRHHLLDLCFQEWKSSATPLNQQKVARAEAVFATEFASQRDLVQKYRALAETINDKWTRQF